MLRKLDHLTGEVARYLSGKDSRAANNLVTAGVVASQTRTLLMRMGT
jgi:hypothetical protein